MREDRPWTVEAVQHLVGLAREGCPVPQMSSVLGRPAPMIRAKLAQLGLTAGHEDPEDAARDAPARERPDGSATPRPLSGSSPAADRWIME